MAKPESGVRLPDENAQLLSNESGVCPSCGINVGGSASP
jgi:hypothetical protein